MNLISTTTITKDISYLVGEDAFIDAFTEIFDNVHCQTLKLETRQEYKADGDKSIEAALRGEWDLARSLIPETHAEELDFYAGMRIKGIDFIRCRPFVRPFTDYLKIEFEHYKYNIEQGERIFVSNKVATHKIFDDFAQHDFMIFDARLAAIYDYDETGKLKGGWVTDKTEYILDLMKLFMFIKSQSLPFLTVIDDIYS